MRHRGNHPACRSWDACPGGRRVRHARLDPTQLALGRPHIARDRDAIGPRGATAVTTAPSGTRASARTARGNESTDDGTIFQQNGRSSELTICCIRGHSAILPSHQFFLHACRWLRASSVLNRPREISSAFDTAPTPTLSMSPKDRAVVWADTNQAAWNQFRVRRVRPRRDVGSGKGRAVRPVRRFVLRVATGLWSWSTR